MFFVVIRYRRIRDITRGISLRTALDMMMQARFYDLRAYMGIMA